MMTGIGGAICVRDSGVADLDAITRIYGHWVRDGLASFELEPPPESEVAARRRALLNAGYPYLVAANESGCVLGYAYAGPYRTRPAYRFACENSIYVAPDTIRSGIGRALLSILIERCEALGFRLMVAVIGDSGNTPSIALHRAFGFRHSGLLPAVGWKHDRWVDSVLMSRPLGKGATVPPVERAT
jgi:phosphinothricin acetyltransferase